MNSRQLDVLDVLDVFCSYPIFLTVGLNLSEICSPAPLWETLLEIEDSMQL